MRSSSVMPTASEKRDTPKMPKLHRLITGVFVSMLVVGFAGIFCTVRGAAGQEYYWTLRLPIAVCLFGGMIGTFFCLIPFLNRLAGRGGSRKDSLDTAIRSDEEAEEELRAKAEALCARLPLIERATWKTKGSDLGLLVVGMIGVFWGYRSNRLGVLLSALVIVAVFLWQTGRSFFYIAEFAPYYIRYRTFRGWRTRLYLEVLEVTPGYGASEVKIWFTDRTKLTLYAERLKPTEILLIITERQMAST